jgi:hypothetical protein
MQPTGARRSLTVPNVTLNELEAIRGRDREIHQWMKAKGWEVTRTNYDFGREVYAWRHDVRGGPLFSMSPPE